MTYRYAIEDFEESILFREHDTIRHMNSRYVQPIKIELPVVDFMQQENKKIEKTEDIIVEKKISVLIDQLHESYTRITGRRFFELTYDPLDVETDYYL